MIAYWSLFRVAVPTEGPPLPVKVVETWPPTAVSSVVEKFLGSRAFRRTDDPG